MSTWDDKPNDYEHALLKIEQIRNHFVRRIEQIRNETIEECAQVAENMANYATADRIRVLKESHDRNL